MEMIDVREGVLSLQRRRGRGAAGDAADGSVEDEVLDELARIVEFVHQRNSSGAPAAGGNSDALAAASVSDGRKGGGGGGGGDVLRFSALERLSYSVFATGLLAAYVGLPVGHLAAQRAKAMEACDLGLRLEQALDHMSDLGARLGARLALAGI